ncbi:large ribosomal subunit protein eL20z-like isoform X1 [Silene latifolia]|uniref:large ribosomal subunit protein eL20z-like isoform X1 n=1 Tax=Silene latifolia TaxID=37657 RepID=UPI003D771223
MGVMEEKKGLTTSTSTDNPSAPPYQPPQQQNHYGTFQGVAYTSHPPPSSHTVVGFPPPPPPPQPPVAGQSPYYFPQGYHAVPGYIVAEVRQLREPKLACCGLGLGWLLFIAGFFFAAIPWYVGALILVCGSVDHREKPGLVACMVGSILAMIAVVFGATGGADSW